MTNEMTQQRDSVKPLYDDVLLLTENGDWYEALDNDAVLLATLTNRVLQKTKDGRAFCFLAKHSLTDTIKELTSKGQRVGTVEHCSDTARNIIRQVPN